VKCCVRDSHRYKVLWLEVEANIVIAAIGSGLFNGVYYKINSFLDIRYGFIYVSRLTDN